MGKVENNCEVYFSLGHHSHNIATSPCLALHASTSQDYFQCSRCRPHEPHAAVHLSLDPGQLSRQAAMIPPMCDAFGRLPSSMASGDVIGHVYVSAE